MKPISIQLYTVRERAKQDFIGVLKEIAATGYKGVEPAGLHGHQPAEIRKVLDDLGMVCSSAHAGLATRENVNEIVDTAKALGYDLVIAGKGPDAFKTAEQIQQTAEAFQTAAELLKPHGLRAGYHNHWWEFERVDGRLGYDLFMELAPDVLSQLDVYWASDFGTVEVPEVLKQWGARIPSLHLKDGPLVKGEPHTAVGAGKMDIPAVVAAADPKVHEWSVVELDECATDMMQAVRDSYRYLTSNKLAAGNV